MIQPLVLDCGFLWILMREVKTAVKENQGSIFGEFRNPKAIAALSLVCKWFDDLAKRVLWKEFCWVRAPKVTLSSGGCSIDGNYKTLVKLLIYCSGSNKGGLLGNLEIPGHFVYHTRRSRTAGRSFLMPQCKNDVLYVSNHCDHLDQGVEGAVGFFRGGFQVVLFVDTLEDVGWERHGVATGGVVSLLQGKVVEHAIS